MGNIEKTLGINLMDTALVSALGSTGKNVVFIESIPEQNALLIDRWTAPTSGKPMKKTKLGDCKDGITALYSPRVGGLLNGISYKPWSEGGSQKRDEVSGKLLTLQDKMEQKWRTPKDFLTNQAWGKRSLRYHEPTYYQDKVWKLNDGSTAFDLDTLDGELGYYVMLDSKFVANSEREYRDRKWPRARFYVAVKNESEEIKFNKNKEIQKSIAALSDKSMTDGRKLEFCWLLGLSTSLSDLTSEASNNLLFDFIQGNNFSASPSNINRFMELIGLLKDEVGRREFKARVLLQKAIDSRVVFEKGETYTWIRPKGTVILGDKYSEAIDFLLNPKKESFIEELKEHIKAKLV